MFQPFLVLNNLVLKEKLIKRKTRSLSQEVGPYWRMGLWCSIKQVNFTAKWFKKRFLHVGQFTTKHVRAEAILQCRLFWYFCNKGGYKEGGLYNYSYFYVFKCFRKEWKMVGLTHWYCILCHYRRPSWDSIISAFTSWHWFGATMRGTCLYTISNYFFVFSPITMYHCLSYLTLKRFLSPLKRTEGCSYIFFLFPMPSHNSVELLWWIEETHCSYVIS